MDEGFYSLSSSLATTPVLGVKDKTETCISSEYDDLSPMNTADNHSTENQQPVPEWGQPMFGKDEPYEGYM